MIKNRITTKTKIKINEKTGKVLEEALEEEISIEETMREGTIMKMIQLMTTDILIFNKMIITMPKRQKLQEMEMGKKILRKQRFHKKFVFYVVILITYQTIVKQDAEAVQEVDKSRSTRSQKN